MKALHWHFARYQFRSLCLRRLIVQIGALRFLGQGSLMLNCANLVAQWFNAKRGFAMSLMALGFGMINYDRGLASAAVILEAS